MARKKIFLIGAGGHAHAVIDVIQADNRYKIMGLIDSYQEPGASFYGYRVVGREMDLPVLLQKHDTSLLFVAIGDNYRRQKMMLHLQDIQPSVEFVTPVHPTAWIGSDVVIEAGSIIMPGVHVIAGCRIGTGCLLNTGSSLDHDSIMQSWSSLGPGAFTGGRVHIGRRTWIGMGAKVLQGINVGRDTVIGAGSVVVNDVPAACVAHGVSCRVYHPRKPEDPYL